MTKLSVNINKIATLRNARGGNLPNLCQTAIDCEKFGAEGITIHPRPDERHIRRKDVFDLRPIVNTEFNIEGYPSKDFIGLIKKVQPEQVTLVPDPPEALTSDTGWDCRKHKIFLSDVVQEFKNTKTRVSIFVNTELSNIEAAAATGTQRIELYTGPYVKGFLNNPKEAVYPFIEAARLANLLKLGINAGHDLNLQNLSFFSNNVPHLIEVSIGHALICDAIYLGLENTIRLYQRALR